MADTHMKEVVRGIALEVARGVPRTAWRLLSPVRPPGGAWTGWWQRPGVGIMYQIEYRPGWEWERDFIRFNESISGPDGRLDFNGPFCRVDEWVDLSRRVGADYHIMESKWHDGICYFDTALTDWKTETDYAGRFAELSREAGIPFMYYYSTVFDHNPQFDSIQPHRDRTISFIGFDETVYQEYIRGHYREIMEKYRPDGMWIDWYWPDRATDTTIDFFRVEYPDVVLTFNASGIFTSSYSRLHYTSSEAHQLEGRHARVVKEDKGVLVVCESAWKWATLGRRVLERPWELISPVGRWWQDPGLRDDPNDLLRMAAIIMSSGGKLCLGATARMDGGIYPEQVDQLESLGDWYRPRKDIFRESVPLRYRHRRPPGVKVRPSSYRATACRLGDDILVHLINMKGETAPVTLELRGGFWKGVRNVYLEPGGAEPGVFRSGSRLEIRIAQDDVDPVESILRLET